MNEASTVDIQKVIGRALRMPNLEVRMVSMFS